MGGDGGPNYPGSEGVRISELYESERVRKNDVAGTANEDIYEFESDGR